MKWKLIIPREAILFSLKYELHPFNIFWITSSIACLVLYQAINSMYQLLFNQ